jgi:hypothetical protein
MMSEDIADILRRWPNRPGEHVRKIVDDIGTEKVQVRITQGAFQGLLQMELEGRPDGLRPYGFKYYLDYYRQSLSRHIEKHGSERGFALDEKGCKRLFEESRRIYERYVFLIQIREFGRVVDDTERNMGLFQFVHQYASREEDRLALQKWWPYVLRMNAEAKLVPLIEEKRFEPAAAVVRQAIRRIEGLDSIDAEEFRRERRRSLRYLGDMARKLRTHVPAEPCERLQQELLEAIIEEHFERAAEIRDELRELGGELPKQALSNLSAVRV